MTEERIRERPWAWPLALAAFAFLGWYASCRIGEARTQVADDAYITYVYGRHVAEGLGFVYNAADAEATPGASSLLHVLVAAGFHRAGWDPLTATRVLSLCALLSIAVAIAWAARRVVGSTPATSLLAGVLVTLGLTFLDETAGHLAEGMETVLFAAVHVWVAAWVACVAAQRGPPGVASSAAGVVVLGLLSIARPEGLLLSAAYLAALLVAGVARAALEGRAAGALRLGLRGLAPVLVAWGVVLVAYLAWKLATFDRLLSNPYYVKTGNAIFGTTGAVLPGLRTTLRFLVMRAGPLLAILVLLARSAGVSRRTQVVAAVLLAPGAALALAYARVIHEMAGGFRYEYALLMPAFVAVGLALAALARRSTGAFLAPALGLGLVAPLFFGPESLRLVDWLGAPRSAATSWLRWRNDANAHARLGLDLADTELGPDATILLSGAGQVPYFSRFRAIDWVGLNDNRLCGREALSIAEVWDYLESQRPDVVFSIFPPATPGAAGRDDDPAFQTPLVQGTLSGRGSGLFRFWDRERLAEMFYAEMCYVRDTCTFGGCYKLGSAWGGDWWIFAYMRSDSPHRDVLLSTFDRSERADRESDLSRVLGSDPRALRGP